MFKKLINKIYFKFLLLGTLKYISNVLGLKILNVERVQKIFGSKINSFILFTGSKGIIKKYFLKFQTRKEVIHEINGNNFIDDNLPKPKIILYSANFSWILSEFLDGELMAEIFIKMKDSDFSDFAKKENEKEILLQKLHSKKEKRINFGEYLRIRANRLFYKRFFGNRFKTYYSKDLVSKYFEYNLFLNGNDLKISINEILTNIRNKYRHPNKENIKVLMGHGDAHHGNIMINEKIWFIDNEYCDFMTPFMEMAKPYYNDFLGTLFFHYRHDLEKHFNITSFEIKGGNLTIDIKYNKQITPYIEVTKIKLQNRQNTCNQSTEDILSLNDYLVLCHMLTKNPNKYPEVAMKLFIAFIGILNQFDPFNPESIYDLLKSSR